jgi:hypothetical protein
MYYMTVTSATVGYGDISPKSDLGRVAAMCMISFAIITVPQMTNELIEKMGLQSVYARARYYPKVQQGRSALATGHVLICGQLASTSLMEFFAELYHSDHSDVARGGLPNSVVLQPSLPSAEMLAILKVSLLCLVSNYH